MADPYGNVLARAAHERGGDAGRRVRSGLIDTVRTHWPFLRDRRIDAYGDLMQRYID